MLSFDSNHNVDFINTIKLIYPIVYSDNEYYYATSYQTISSVNYSIENEFEKQYDMSIEAARDCIDRYPNSIIANYMEQSIKHINDVCTGYETAASHKVFHDKVIDKLDDLQIAIDVFHWLRVECSDFIIRDFYNYDRIRS